MSFDLLAPHYRWMEVVLAGEKLQRCRTAHLERIAAAQTVLMLGEGNGRFLCECRHLLPRAHITCVDASAGMLQQARARLQSEGLDDSNVEFIHANALEWNPPQGQYDVIVTHFFLDCFTPEQLDLLVPRLAGSARGKAVWLLADFREAEQGMARWRTRWILAVMYLFFRGVTRLPARWLTQPDALLERAGFRRRARNITEWGLLHTDCWELDAPAKK